MKGREDLNVFRCGKEKGEEGGEEEEAVREKLKGTRRWGKRASDISRAPSLYVIGIGVCM